MKMMKIDLTLGNNAFGDDYQNWSTISTMTLTSPNIMLLINWQNLIRPVKPVSMIFKKNPSFDMYMCRLKDIREPI